MGYIGVGLKPVADYSQATEPAIRAASEMAANSGYVQAKRWQDSVGRPVLQACYGALAGQKAKTGDFITTSGYTPQAIDFAKSVEGIVLIDGTRLASLMIDYEIGVASRTIKIPKIDGDYFDESAV